MQSPPSEGSGAEAQPAPGEREGAARARRWRLPAIETYPRVVAFVQTLPGKLLLFALFAVLMKLNARGLWLDNRYMWLALTVVAAVVSLGGRFRGYVLLACGAGLLVYAMDWIGFEAVWTVSRQEDLLGLRFLRAGTVAVFLPLAALAIHLARRYRDHPLASRPVLAEHVLFVCLLGLAASHVLRGVPQVLLWCLIAVFSAYFSFLAYALIDQRQRRPAPLYWQLATFNPFCLPTPIPMGKGAANFRALEARSSRDLAVTQLKALKLLVWALILKLVLWVFRWTIYQKLGVPPLTRAFEEFLRTGEVPAPFGLLSVIANFPEQLLMVAVWGHAFVAVARLAGFGLLRNTCRPLSARTIADFWNRYLYYFKEVLVNVYFYPTYVRCFKKHPRLRIAFATFMAAGVGNFFLHFVMNSSGVVRFGLVETLVRTQTYAFYCIVLVAGIVLSQLRPPSRAETGWLRGRFAPVLGVMVFFCFLSFFDGPQGHVSLAQHFRFLFQVFNPGPWIKAIG